MAINLIDEKILLFTSVIFGCDYRLCIQSSQHIVFKLKFNTIYCVFVLFDLSYKSLINDLALNPRNFHAAMR